MFLQIGGGRGWHRVETPLPREQKALEFEIGRRFALALRRASLFDFEKVLPAPEPSDLILLSPSLGRVGVQVVEMVDANAARRSERKESLLAEVRQNLDGTLPCAFLIRDTRPHEDLPRPGTKSALALANQLVATIERAARAVLAKNAAVSYWSVPSRGRFWIDAITDARWGAKGVDWPIQGGRSTDLLLDDVVRGKIDKAYPSPGHLFWLLVYSVGAGLFPGTADRARLRLQLSDHPFQQVWFLQPLPTHEGGLVERVWPTA